MPKHKHAELIKAWADGAEIQRCLVNSSYAVEDDWLDDKEPVWYVNREYRIKPKPPVVLAGIEVPKPVKVEKGFYAVAVSPMGHYVSQVGGSLYHQEMYAKCGLLHDTAEKAQKHADALNAFHKQLMEN